MRISDWSSDVCSSDLDQYLFGAFQRRLIVGNLDILARGGQALDRGAQQRHLAMHRCQPILDPRKRSRRIAVCLRIVETIILFLHSPFLPALFDNFSQLPPKSNVKEKCAPKGPTAKPSP